MDALSSRLVILVTTTACRLPVVVGCANGSHLSSSRRSSSPSRGRRRPSVASPTSHTLNPSSRKHFKCASIRYRHFSSSCSGMHASRAFFVIGHAQQIFFGFVSGAAAVLLAPAPMAGEATRRRATATTRRRRRRRRAETRDDARERRGGLGRARDGVATSRRRFASNRHRPAGAAERDEREMKDLSTRRGKKRVFAAHARALATTRRGTDSRAAAAFTPREDAPEQEEGRREPRGQARSHRDRLRGSMPSEEVPAGVQKGVPGGEDRCAPAPYARPARWPSRFVHPVPLVPRPSSVANDIVRADDDVDVLRAAARGGGGARRLRPRLDPTLILILPTAIDSSVRQSALRSSPRRSHPPHPHPPLPPPPPRKP